MSTEIPITRIAPDEHRFLHFGVSCVSNHSTDNLIDDAPVIHSPHIGGRSIREAWLVPQIRVDIFVVGLIDEENGLAKIGQLGGIDRIVFDAEERVERLRKIETSFRGEESTQVASAR